MLGLTPTIMETLGGGYCSKGTMAGRILIPLRTETGELKGYCGIATKAEQAPLLLFPRSLEARCKPTKPEPDKLRKLFASFDHFVRLVLTYDSAMRSFVEQYISL